MCFGFVRKAKTYTLTLYIRRREMNTRVFAAFMVMLVLAIALLMGNAVLQGDTAVCGASVPACQVRCCPASKVASDCPADCVKSCCEAKKQVQTCPAMKSQTACPSKCPKTSIEEPAKACPGEGQTTCSQAK